MNDWFTHIIAGAVGLATATLGAIGVWFKLRSMRHKYDQDHSVAIIDRLNTQLKRLDDERHDRDKELEARRKDMDFAIQQVEAMQIGLIRAAQNQVELTRKNAELEGRLEVESEQRKICQDQLWVFMNKTTAAEIKAEEVEAQTKETVIKVEKTEQEVEKVKAKVIEHKQKIESIETKINGKHKAGGH